MTDFEVRHLIAKLYCKTDVSSICYKVERLRNIEKDMKCYEVSWVPVMWANRLVQEAWQNEQTKMDILHCLRLIDSFDYIEECNRKTLNYGWINFPLA